MKNYQEEIRRTKVIEAMREATWDGDDPGEENRAKLRAALEAAGIKEGLALTATLHTLIRAAYEPIDEIRALTEAEKKDV